MATRTVLTPAAEWFRLETDAGDWTHETRRATSSTGTARCC